MLRKPDTETRLLPKLVIILGIAIASFLLSLTVADFEHGEPER